MNSVILIGRLTNDPEPKIFQSGTSSTTFTVAVDRDYKKKDGTKETDFIFCQATGKQADFINQYITKGRLVAINGSLYVDRYEKDGEKKTITKVFINKIKVLDRQKDNVEGQQEGFQQMGNDEIPF